MTTHDPRQVIENLRDHLAVHDRRLAFLFGAGSSSAVNIAPEPEKGKKHEHKSLIPGIDGLTAACATAVKALGAREKTAWELLVQHCKQNNRQPNVENLLSQVRLKIEAISKGETLVGLDHAQLSKVEKTMCATVAEAVSPASIVIPKWMPHDEFANWAKKVNRTEPLEIFTTNYDILFERAFEACNVPVFDGFVGTLEPFFYSECLDDDVLLPKPKWVRLWKLHGSVNWARGPLHADEKDRTRIIRTQPSKSGELILPSDRKYMESRKQPYLAYMDRLSKILNLEHALLITCGYSFGDEHINASLYGALDSRDTTNIIALHYLDLQESDELVKIAARRPNLTVIGPNAAVISGSYGTWQLTEAVDNKTSSFMDAAFDSNAQPEDEGSPAATSTSLTGRMRVVDFNWFCKFLNAMAPSFQ